MINDYNTFFTFTTVCTNVYQSLSLVENNSSVGGNHKALTLGPQKLSYLNDNCL